MCKTCTKLWLWVWAQESNVVHVCRLSVCLATAELPAYSVTSVGGVLWVMAAMKIVTKLLQCVHDLLINVFCISTRLCLFIIYDALTDSKAWQHCELCHSDHSSYLSTVLCHPRHASFQFFLQFQCLSVRPSHATIESILMIVGSSIFHHRVLVVVAHRLVFWYQLSYLTFYSQGNPLRGLQTRLRWVKRRFFDQSRKL